MSLTTVSHCGWYNTLLQMDAYRQYNTMQHNATQCNTTQRYRQKETNNNIHRTTTSSRFRRLSLSLCLSLIPVNDHHQLDETTPGAFTSFLLIGSGRGRRRPRVSKKEVVIASSDSRRMMFMMYTSFRNMIVCSLLSTTASRCGDAGDSSRAFALTRVGLTCGRAARPTFESGAVAARIDDGTLGLVIIDIIIAASGVSLREEHADRAEVRPVQLVSVFLTSPADTLQDDTVGHAS